MHIRLHGITTALTVLALAACSSSPAEPPAGGAADLGGRTLNVGTDATYPPFESMTAEGQIEGIDPSLLTAICEVANCVPKFQNTAWDGIFGALKAGEFDVLMSSITVLPEREANSGGKFTVPYFEVGQVLLAKSPTDLITSTESLTDEGIHVGVQTGTTGDTAAGDLGVADANMSRFDTIGLAVEALLNGDVDVVVLDNPTADVYMAQHSSELAIVGEPFTTEQIAILVPAEDTEVLAALNAAIEQLRADGTIDGIIAEWYTKAEAGSEGG